MSKKKLLNSAGNRIIVSFILLSLFFTISVYKVFRYSKYLHLHINSDVGLFASEGALQYRYARMIANGHDIPKNDKKCQWPQGVKPFKELTLVMEYVIGTSYQILKNIGINIPFHIFVVIFISFFTSLNVFVIYWGIRGMGFNRWIAAYSAAFYAFTTGSYSRITGFELEYFAFPLLMLGTIFFIKSVSENKVNWAAILSGFFFAIGLASWHFAQFYFFILSFIFFLLLLFLLREKLLPIGKIFTILVSFAFLAGVISPVLRNTLFVVSPVMIFSLMLVIAYWFVNKYELNAAERVFFAIGFILITGIAIFIKIGFAGGEYGHVWYLLWAKLINFGIKPDTPSALSYDARVLWTGAFNTMSPFILLYQFRALLLFGIIGTFLLGYKIKKNMIPTDLILFLLIIVTFVLSVLVQRLVIFAVFFLSMSIPFLISSIDNFHSFKSLEKKQKNAGISTYRSLIFIVILFICLFFQINETLSYENTFFTKIIFSLFPEPNYDRPYLSQIDKFNLYKWINDNTSKNEVFLTNFELSASILAYTNRASNLQPKFETSLARNKVKKFLSALYNSDESNFWNYCLDNQTDYFIYPVNDFLEEDPDSYKYLQNSLDENKNRMVYRFHFRANELKHFSLVYRNGFYEVFKVLKSAQQKPQNNNIIRYPIFEESVYNKLGKKEFIKRLKLTYQIKDRMHILLKQSSEKQIQAKYFITRSIPNCLPDPDFNKLLSKF